MDLSEMQPMSLREASVRLAKLRIESYLVFTKEVRHS